MSDKQSKGYEIPTCKKCETEYSLRDGCDPSDYCDECAQEIVVRLLETLEEIAEPIKFMRRRAEAEGNKINGQMAVALSDDPQFLKAIARTALKELKQEESHV